jgi:hypothetical protein
MEALMPEPFDLNGVWIEDGFPVGIQHTGSRVEATWLYVPSECEPIPGGGTIPRTEDFDGTLSGAYISGQILLCSTSGVRYGTFELIVAADGNRLEGHWQGDDPPTEEPLLLERCANWVEAGELEIRDNQRWQGLGLSKVSWYWPASFYMTVRSDGTGTFEGTTYSLSDDAWIVKSGYFHRVDPAEMITGDVVVFRGKRARPAEGEEPPEGAVAHSAIATGRGDEVSQMWWTRDIRRSMRKNDQIVSPPDGAHRRGDDGYTVTRDSLADLQVEFTEGATRDGDTFLVSPYQVWRRRSLSEPDFSDLAGPDACDAWPARHIVRPYASSSWFNP